MEKKLRGFGKNVGGFTLIELIIVMGILGLLSAIAIPQFSKVLDNSELKTDQANLVIVQTALEVYKAENNGNAPVLATGEGDDFEKLVGALQTGKYLKEGAITSKSGGTFSYENGEVSFSPPSNPTPST